VCLNSVSRQVVRIRTDCVSPETILYEAIVQHVAKIGGTYSLSNLADKKFRRNNENCIVSGNNWRNISTYAKVVLILRSTGDNLV
jgi:hypothetical protein